MATRLYWRSDASSPDSPGSSQSAVLPIGTNNSLAGGENQAMLEIEGSVTETTIINTLAQTARQSGYFGIFTSEPLAAQTISAQTWQVVLRRRESNAAANAFLAASIYIWRPSTSSVVGFIFDNNAQQGAEWGTTFATITYNLAGSSVTCADGDVLVIEPWYTAAQGMGTTYTVEIQYNNLLFSYLDSPQTLTFYTPPAPPKERSFAHIIY